MVIRADSGVKLLCIAFPMVERMMLAEGRVEELEAIKRAAAEQA